jgi:hypothetical protein
VRAVRPKRLLATVTEDLWDIYENRVAVRLVDHLLRDVSRRIAEVREVSHLYDQALQDLSRAEGTHWRQQRLFRLWGRQLKDAEQGLRIAGRRSTRSSSCGGICWGSGILAFTAPFQSEHRCQARCGERTSF